MARYLLATLNCTCDLHHHIVPILNNFDVCNLVNNPMIAHQFKSTVEYQLPDIQLISFIISYKTHIHTYPIHYNNNCLSETHILQSIYTIPVAFDVPAAPPNFIYMNVDIGYIYSIYNRQG